MNDSDWIVCERSNRWAAALRLVLDGQNRVDGRRCRLREVRTLADLAASLSEGRMCLASVEVRPATLGAALAWLAKAEKAVWRDTICSALGLFAATRSLGGGRVALE